MRLDLEPLSDLNESDDESQSREEDREDPHPLFKGSIKVRGLDRKLNSSKECTPSESLKTGPVGRVSNE